MREWRAQLLYFEDVLWHARPAFSKAVVAGGMDWAISWSLWCLFPGGVRSVGGGLAGRVGCVVEGVGCLPLSVTRGRQRLARSEEVRAEMSCWVVFEVPSCGDGPGVKPERQVVPGAKFSVSGMGMQAHVVVCGFARIDLRRCMSNSWTSVVALWVVVS